MLDRHGEAKSRFSPTMVTLAMGLLLAAGLAATGVVAHAAPASTGVKQVTATGLASTVGARLEAPATSTTTTSAAPAVRAAPVATQTTGPRPARTAVSASAVPIVASAPNPTTTTTAVPPGPPRVAPSTTVPRSNGTGSWHSNVVDGVYITLQMSPVSPVAGETVHFSVTVTYQQGQGCCADFFNAGDGAFIQLPQHDTGPCGAAHPAAFTEQADHVYSQPGVFGVAFNPGVLATCQAPPAFINAAQLYASVVVRAAS